MSLVRAALLRQNRAALAAVPRRSASSSSAVTEHDHHDEHHHEDNTVYPPETFANKYWRNFVLVTLAGLAIYKYAPSPEEESLVSRLVAHYKPPAELWQQINSEHIAQSAESQTGALLVASAKVNSVHRYRFPQMLDQHSAFCQPVGLGVDMSNVAVKTDKE
ncbi:hypothetical protein NM688_g5378 [Phlebia brevispora]|uniref:Uncharacterized protein n=1 Tax=Phlebia brevispora TaxID=194682 RepID=A0ACC1SWA4_9APHY|nr:hypothetical protein NM688_g5378 [Phlebia brevispora]